MVDAAIEEYKKLNKTDVIPEDLQKKKDSVHKEYTDLKNACSPLTKALNDEKLMKLKDNHRTEGLLEELKSYSDVKEDQIDLLYRYAKLNFDCGLYEKCANYLADYRLLTKDEEKKFVALWGKLAAEILTVHFEVAFKDVLTLRDAIDSRTHVDQVSQLQQRSWLLHWSLFLLFNLKSEEEKTQIVDFFFSDKYLNTIQLNCPHLLRYLTAAVIIRRTHDIKEIIRVLKQERDYKDPITEFFILLNVEFDFNAIRINLQQCEKLLKYDLFLAPVASEFLENARLLVFETYCRIHQIIDIPTLANILDLKEDVEQYLVEYIRQARVSAKIDNSKNQLLITPKQSSVYQQVINSTKVLAYRSGQLMSNIEKQYAKQGD